MGRRLAAVVTVVCLIALAVTAPALFGGSSPDGRNDGGERGSRGGSGGSDGALEDGEPSLYSPAFAAAAGCRPAPVAASEPGGAESVELIAEEVERLRDLEFEDDPPVTFLTQEALAAHVADLSREELADDEVEAEVDALKRLRLVPDDFDIDAFIDSTAQQVLGLYDPQTQELLVGSSGALDAIEQITVAHELDHALTDQAFGLPDLRWDADRADAQSAERALIEGDATLLMQHYGILEFPDRIQEVLGGSATEAQRRDFQNLPYILRRSLAFPYQEGFLFTCALYSGKGWRAVNRAYDSPPESTLEIVFPGLYGEIEPEIPDDPRPPGRGWDKAHSAALGAVDLQWMFEAPAGRFTGNVAEEARQVSRWRGGRFHVWQQDEEIVVALSIVEDDHLAEGDSPSICNRLIQWYSASVPEADFAVDEDVRGVWSSEGEAAAVDCEGNQTRFVAAPELRTAVRVARF